MVKSCESTWDHFGHGVQTSLICFQQVFSLDATPACAPSHTCYEPPNRAISRQKSFMPSWLVEARGRVVNLGGISTTAVQQKIFQEFDVGVGSQA